MTAGAKSTSVIAWALPTAGAEDIDLHQLVADDVESDEEHAIGHQFRAHDVDHFEHLVGDDHLGGAAAGRHIRAHVALGVLAAEGGIGTLLPQRPAVHDEEADIALLRLGQILLRHDITIPADGFDDLVEVGGLLAIDEEDPAAAGALQGFQDGPAAEVSDELRDQFRLA